ncbi:uncharacterized protein [Littorina saxatilis]|uniref:Uncharacterized protein n=1 Tax=Littorina saxatilis TaxID=31220 RepID=A0AAN9B607_9CAEN
MSFESVFKNWLVTQDGDQKEGMDTGAAPQPATDDPAGDPGAEEEMPEIQQEAWREEDVKGMPVLQRMDSPPLSPPPPLQITISLKDSPPASRFSNSSDTGKAAYKSKSGSEKKDKAEGTKDVKEKPTEERGVEEKKHSQCHSRSALLELTDLSHSTSPTAPRCLEVDLAESIDQPSQESKDKSPNHCAMSKHSPRARRGKAQTQMLSPERDCPMEPDSTSECLVKWHRPRLGSDATVTEVSPRCEVSPHSAVCIAAATPGNSCSELGLAECDSTSMFLSSPSAISPASQGDEERGCPVLTDHEDGASPAHFVCQCRSLPPPTDLVVHRDHVPTNAPSPRKPLGSTHLMASGTISEKCATKSWPPLVIHRSSLDDDAAPNLEKMVPSLDPGTEPAEQELLRENISPPILTHSEQEAVEKQFQSSDSQSKVCASEVPPPLVKYETKPSNKTEYISVDTKVLDSPPVLSLPEEAEKTDKDSAEFNKSAEKYDTVKHCSKEGRTSGAEKVSKPSLKCDLAKPNRTSEGKCKRSDLAKTSKTHGKKSDLDKPNKAHDLAKPNKRHGEGCDFKASKTRLKVTDSAKPYKKQAETSDFPKPNKKHTEAGVCDFAKNIDWQSAVVETVESPPGLTKQEGESKRGIILKIRTKSVAPKVEPAPEKPEPAQEPNPNPTRIERKRHTIDSPEMVSRLRKRQKSGETEKPAVPEAGEEMIDGKHSKDCDSKTKRQKAGKAGGCQCCNRVSPKYRRPRRNTVQLGEDLKAHTAHLPDADRKFVSAAIDLSRLQSQAHDLVYTLFPRLQPQLSNVAPESARFAKIIDDIIAELEGCDSDKSALDPEDLCQRMKTLTLNAMQRNELVPVFSPHVTLCRSPYHSLEEFQGKVCALLQLLLPDLPVSLSNSLSKTSNELEVVMTRVVMANKVKVARKCSF